MTYALTALAALAFSCAFGKLLKRNLELNYPSVDDDGEIESFLAAGLELALAKDAA
jgi:hypothetical protein